MTTTRREALKLGAIAATPIVALAPAAALAADDTATRLARLEDERAIETLAREWLAEFNRSYEERRGETVRPGPVSGIAPDMKSMQPDWDNAALAFFDDTHADLDLPIEIERVTEHTGDTTIERMARFQGQPRATSREQARLHFTFVRHPDRWLHPSVRLHKA